MAEVKKSDSLYEALKKVQANVMVAKQSATNPFHKNKYSTLKDVWQACRDELNKANLVVSQYTSVKETGLIMNTDLISLSGEKVHSELPLILTKDDMQQLGSAITYARRYGLATVVGVISDEDDDGNVASAPAKSNSQSLNQSAPPRKAPVDAGTKRKQQDAETQRDKEKTRMTGKQLQTMYATLKQKGIDQKEQADKAIAKLALVEDLGKVSEADADKLITELKAMDKDSLDVLVDMASESGGSEPAE